MEEEDLILKIDTSNAGTFSLINRCFKIDFDKVQTIDDIKIVLKAMHLSIYWHSDECPEQFKEVYDKGFLIEEKQN